VVTAVIMKLCNISAPLVQALFVGQKSHISISALIAADLICHKLAKTTQMPSPLSWGIGRTATLFKTLLQYYGKYLEALPGVAYPGLGTTAAP